MIAHWLVALLLASLQSDPYRLAENLFSSDAAERAVARDALIARGDRSIAPALVDAVFFNSAGRAETVAVLEHLLGERHGNSYREWVEAIGRRSDITPASGYVSFKAKLFSRIDPAFSEFLRENVPRTIRAEEIVWGGVKKDAIPPLNDPKFIDAGAAAFMTADERVLGVSIAGDERAYPTRILDWHEMTNDRVGGKRVVLSYCTLCGAAILYDAKASDGRTYTFGTSGMLYRSNKLMYDRETKTLWSQFTGEPVMGPLAGKRIRLAALPITVTTWHEWKTMHPRTRVLSLDTGYVRDYRPGVAYGKYFASRELMFPVWKQSTDGRAPKEWVFVVVSGAERKIYPLAELIRKPIVHDVLGGREIVIVTDAASEAVRAYESSGRRFRRASDQELEDERSHERFVVTEEALVRGDVRLPRVAGHRAYWFGAYALLPEVNVYRP